MKIEKVSANIRYSQDSGKGSWKSVELSAEASIDQRDNWKQSQSELYFELGAQLRSLWSSGTSNGTGAVVNRPDAAETAIEPPPKPEPIRPPREHWCAEHQAAFTQRKGKDGGGWWSHQATDGSWCREPAEKQA